MAREPKQELLRKEREREREREKKQRVKKDAVRPSVHH
jgi:hypothetical protein